MGPFYTRVGLSRNFRKVLILPWDSPVCTVELRQLGRYMSAAARFK